MPWRGGRYARCLMAMATLLVARATALDCTMDNQTLAYTMRRIQRAKVEMKPYPHVHIKEIFHPQFYKCILSKLPDGSARGRNSPFKNFKSERYLVKLYDRTGNQLEDQNKYSKATSQSLDIDFWQRFADMFATHDLAKAWVELLDATTGKRYNKEEEKLKFTYRMDLSRDMTGYEISPHTDTDFKWVTTLFYLPSTAKHANVGTAVMESKRGLLQRSGTRHVPWGPDWKVAKRAPFIPNSVFAFAPCWHSWHAVPKVSDRVMRDTIQAFVLSSKRTDKFPCGT